MATYEQIYALSQETNITAQIAVAITKDAQYALQTSTDPVMLKWAQYVVPNAAAEAKAWQVMICKDPAIADIAWPPQPAQEPAQEPQPQEDPEIPPAPEPPPDPIVAQPVPDDKVQAAVTALITTMAQAYDRANPDPVRA